MRGLAFGIVVTTLGCASAPGPTSYGVTEPGSQMEFGVKMAQRGLWDEALFRFEQAAELDGSSAKSYNNVAVAQEALGLYDEALASYQKALRLDPSNPDLKRNYARFVEFYQNFKPKDKAASAEPSSEESEGDAGMVAGETSNL